MFNNKKNSIKSSLRNLYPKIGIRPTIDARMGGIRESLENQTMNMAKSVINLLSSNLKYPNGKSVDCIISDTTIGGVAEAARAEEKFEREGVRITITVTPCWCYGSEVMDINPYTFKAVWGFNGTERPGAVYLAAALAAHNQKGIPAFSIYGKDVQDKSDNYIPKDVQEKLLRFARSSIAASIIRGKSYLAIGGVSMGIAGSIIDPDFLESYLGMRYEYIDMSEIIRRINLGIYDKDEFVRAIEWVKNSCREGKDNNSKEQIKSRVEKDKDWETVVKMTLIAKDLMVGNAKLEKEGFYEEALGHNAIAGGFQGQRHWTDFLPNGDFTETILNSSFDWNGTRKPFIFATENDYLNAISMLFGHLLTNTAQIFADVRTYWSPEAVKRVTGLDLPQEASTGIIHLINSGSAALDGTGKQKKDGKPIIKPFWQITKKEVSDMLQATLFRPANLDYFRGGGFSTDYLSEGSMPVTMSRINLAKGLGPVLQIAEGFTVTLNDKIHNIIDKRTDSTWPTTWFTPVLTGKGAFTDAYSVMNNWGANHASICYGHIGADLITLASMLRIPVCLHNVEKERIFRPSAWNAFGTLDLEGADFRACKNFGPIYGAKSN